MNWSILGSALIVFTTYFQVQVSVAINAWYGPFYDLIQAAVSKSRPVTSDEFWVQFAIFAGIAFVAVFVGILTNFFVSHYIFRWRTAMNDFYMANWQRLRAVEGAAQRVQEDTMNFAQIMESLGVNFVNSVMTLIAFLPVLIHLVGKRQRAADRRSHALSPGYRRHRLVDFWHGPSGADWGSPAGLAIPQPAR